VFVTRSAGPVDDNALAGGVALLTRRGLQVHGPTPLAPAEVPWLAGSDDARLHALIGAIAAPGARAVLEARGGYGVTRIVDRLPRGLLRRHPRWLVGYSDITALHLWAAREGVASVHAPMVAGLARQGGDAALDELLALLGDPRAPRAWEGLARAGTTRVPTRCEGIAVGGNLSLLAALAGTWLLPDLRGAVLFVEDVGEAPYRVDRLLTTLLGHGRADGLRGIVIGDFTGDGDAATGADVVARRARELVGRDDVVIVRGAPFGHGAVNRPFVLGVPVAVTVRGDGSARVEWPGGAPSSPAPIRPRRSPIAMLEDAVRDGVCSAAQLDVRVSGALRLGMAIGWTRSDRSSLSRPITAETCFDLASLTKAVSTALIAWHAVEIGALDPGDRIPRDLAATDATLAELLRHTSGLPAHVEFFRDAREVPESERRHRAEQLAAATAAIHTRGSPCYSDVGFIALGRWLERVLGAPLDALFERVVRSPLGLLSTGFRGVDGPADGDVAATEYCPWRGAVLQGTVHDENCQVLGGVAGHAGLFGCAADVGRVAQCLLGFGPPLLRPETVGRMWDDAARTPGGSFVGGWDTPSGASSTAGRLVRRDATFGHLGFTGTSVWIDRSRDLSIVLLTNRVHPSRASDLIRALRPAIHDAVIRAIFPERP
jgi:muramoyltetrapeptide carboxypeptidase LdcA involved in peptidoglycan recycling